jgi:hypothetical protein
MGDDHALDVGLQREIVAALLGQEGGALVRRQRHGGVIQVDQALPAIVHGRCSRSAAGM